MVDNRIRIDMNERMAGVKIIQNAKVKIQNYKFKVKSFFALLFNLIHQPCTVLVQGQLAD